MNDKGPDISAYLRALYQYAQTDKARWDLRDYARAVGIIVSLIALTLFLAKSLME